MADQSEKTCGHEEHIPFTHGTGVPTQIGWAPGRGWEECPEATRAKNEELSDE